MGVKLSWGKRKTDERIIHITEAVNGLKCECVCPKCGVALIARQGPRNKQHFAHEGDLKCKWAPETALHLLAKQIVSEYRYIRLSENRVFFYDEAVLEKPMTGLVSDVWIRNASEELLVEIFVTHEVTPRKADLILANNYRAIEINLSGVDRNVSKEELTHILIEQIEGKRIIQQEIIARQELMISETKEDNTFFHIAILVAFIIALLTFFIWIFNYHRRRRRWG